MDDLEERGGFTLSNSELEAMRVLLSAEAVDEAEVERTIRDVAANSGYICDPHTAVGLAAASRYTPSEIPMVTLATAHPAKFPDAVEAASGIRPPLPERMSDLYERAERITRIGNDLGEIETLIKERTGI
jgi:threonine synthase